MTALRPARARTASLAILVGIAVLAVMFGAAGCKAKSTKTSALPAPAVTLPPGDLVTYVPQPEEVPAGMVPLLAQTGPADIAKLSTFSSDPAAARTDLAKHGFSTGYIAEYADPASGRSITVVVSRFATAQGALEDLSADLGAKPPKGARTLLLQPVGEQSGGVTQPLPNGPKGAELITVRFRVGAMTWLVAVAANGSVSVDAVSQVASNLAKRAQSAASATPSPAK